MAEYIDKEALCNWCLETGPSYCDQCVMNREGIPAADVRENGPILTKADEIRAMSDEELAEWHKKMMEGYCPRPTSECPNDCCACWLGWLKQEVEK